MACCEARVATSRRARSEGRAGRSTTLVAWAKISLVCAGGIRNGADVAKALALGTDAADADLVRCDLPCLAWTGDGARPGGGASPSTAPD
jgi:hypothetical protein